MKLNVTFACVSVFWVCDLVELMLLSREDFHLFIWTSYVGTCFIHSLEWFYLAHYSMHVLTSFYLQQ